MNPLADLLWAEFHDVCQSEVVKVQDRLGPELSDEARAHLRTMADEITIRLVAHCLDAVSQAATEDERVRTIEAMIRTFGRERLRALADQWAG